MGQNLHERMGSMQSGIATGYRSAEEAVSRNPAPSLLLGFGVGFGLGLILTTMLSRPEESWSDWTERHARDTMKGARDSMHHAEHTARHLPDSFHHLAESIRHLPEAIARHLPSSLSRHS